MNIYTLLLLILLNPMAFSSVKKENIMQPYENLKQDMSRKKIAKAIVQFVGVRYPSLFYKGYLTTDDNVIRGILEVNGNIKSISKGKEYSVKFEGEDLKIKINNISSSSVDLIIGKKKMTVKLLK